MLVLLLICPISSLQFDKRPPRVPILTVRRNLITSHALLGTTLSEYLAGLCLENVSAVSEARRRNNLGAVREPWPARFRYAV